MRFDYETRAKVREAAPGVATIRWPTGAPEPEKGRVYRMQSLEAAKEQARRHEERPDTHAEVMAQMHKRRYGKLPEGYKPPRRRPTPPSADDPYIRVLSVTILERGWEATVELFEEPDPVRHSGIKAKVPAGLHPIFGHAEKVELEPEKIVSLPSRTQREDEEESLRIESAASADRAELARLERKYVQERRKGKSAKRTGEALERARRRVEFASAGEVA